MDMKQAIQRVADRQDLTGEEAGEVMELLLTGAATQAQIGAFLTGLRMKGETIDEIAGLASVLADKAEAHSIRIPIIILIWFGTGGDCTYLFQISLNDICHCDGSSRCFCGKTWQSIHFQQERCR